MPADKEARTSLTVRYPLPGTPSFKQISLPPLL